MSEINNLPIPEEEKSNIQKLLRLIKSGDNTVDLEVVGGVKDKKWPRKDIDITISVDNGVGDTELERAKDKLDKIEEKVGKAISGSEFVVSKKTIPYIDHEFNNDNILAHEGSLEIQPKTGTPIELIPKKK